VQLIPVLQLRQRDTLALRGIAWRRLRSVAALRHVYGSRLVFPEIQSRHRADTANREPTFERQIIPMQPTAKDEPGVDPRRRGQTVVTAEIDERPAIRNVGERRWAESAETSRQNQ